MPVLDHARRLVSLLPLVLTAVALASCVVKAPVTAPGERFELETPTRLPDLRPIKLTARDGTDLPLVSLELKGTVEDPLAFTELHLEFENLEPRALDARLELRLPARARVTRFATQIEGSWREAEVVEREAGRLQPSLYAAAEPAIDTTPDSDQRFEVTLPDIPGRSTQKLIVSYAETFPNDDDPYRVRLAGLHDVPRFEAKVVVRGQPDPLLEVFAGSRIPEELGIDESGVRRLELRRLDWTATDDLVVPNSGLRRTGVRNGRMVAARINPLTHDHAAPINGLTILFDTSASRAVGYAERVEALARLIEAMQPWTGNEIWLRLIAFDQSHETIYAGPLGELDRDAFQQLLDRRALGASDLVSVLRATGARRGHEVDRVLLISDGVATSGVAGRSMLLRSVSELADSGVRRVDVIADPGTRDDWTLRSVVRQLPESGLVLDGEHSPRELVRRMLRTVHDEVQIAVPGARWYYPESVSGVQSDDEILVYADFADPETIDGALRVSVESHGKQTWTVPLVEVEEPLVAWAHENAQVEFLVKTLEDKAEGQPLAARKQLWRRIVRGSKRHRVVNDYTRLVMPAEQHDYLAVGLDPTALPDVLFAGPEGVQRRARGIPNALVDADVPLARERLPRFPSRNLGADQLILLARDQSSAAGSSPTRGPDADAVMAVGELAEPDELPAPVDPPAEVEPEPDPAVAELERLRRAKPLDGRRRTGRPRSAPPKRDPEDAYRGNLLTIMNLLDWGNVAEAKQVAWRWREADPTDVMAVVALGEALEANAEVEAAARAYGSIIDMFPERADMRRFAGSRLEHLGSAGGRLAINSYRRAREQRPDHPSSHRLLAFALLRAGRHESAFEVLAAALRRSWSGQFTGVEKVLREDLGLIGAVWAAREPEARKQIRARLRQVGAKLASEASLRFVLTWETGANDVDLHVRDVLGTHAYYESRGLSSGGALYFDVTEGYGPEVFTILGQPSGYPYNLQVHYYARGPSGYGMGKVQIIEHDGAGGIEFDERPFVINKERAYVDLGSVEGPLGK